MKDQDREGVPEKTGLTVLYLQLGTEITQFVAESQCLSQNSEAPEENMQMTSKKLEHPPMESDLSCLVHLRPLVSSFARFKDMLLTWNVKYYPQDL